MFGQSKEKIGVGLITCNRASQFQGLYSSVLNCQDVDQIVVVKNKDYDYSDVLQIIDQKKTVYIHEPQDLGVGHCKNLALLELLNSGCQHIFLIEDDITLKDQRVFQEYIATAKEFKLEHLIFGSVYTPPSWKLDPVIATFQCNGKKLDIYPNLHGGFVYFSRRCLELAGLFDEKNYINAVEHIDHTYRIIQMGMYTPFWRFADVHDSGRLLQDEQPSNPSTINDKSELQKQRTRQGFQKFAMTYGKQIAQIPKATFQEVESYLKGLNPKVSFDVANASQQDKQKKTIRCFSIDHRNTSGKWPFSWTRVGTGFCTDAKLKDTDGESICTERFNTFLGEWTAMWWIWKHLTEIGEPDFVGMTQYRRYFTRSKPNYGPFPIVNLEGLHIEQAKLDEICQRAILSPDDLLNIIKASNSDGILPARFPDYSYMAGCKSVQDLMFVESNFLHLGMPRSLVDAIFQLFQEEAIASGFSSESIQQAFQRTNTFHFNMFVLAIDDFNTCMKIINQVVMKSVEHIDSNHIEGLHARLFGYVIERLFSCMFFLLSESRKKSFTELPIILLPKEEMQSLKLGTETKEIANTKVEQAKQYLTTTSKPKYSILSFIMGDKYELVHEIQQKLDNIEYVLVTDNKNLKSDTWNVIFDEKLLKYNSPFERCFRVRYNAFDYINTDICVTIDGSMEVKGSLDPIVQKFVEEDYDICLMPHPFRFDFISEYQAWIKQRRYPVERTKKFFELLQNSKYDPNFRGLIQLCFSIKKRDCQKTRALDSLVFSFLEYLSVESSFERLDQTVYTFVLNTWFKDLKILPISEQIVRSEAIQWYCHNSMKKNMNFFMQPGKPDRRWLLNREVECLQLLNGEVVFPKAESSRS